VGGAGPVGRGDRHDEDNVLRRGTGGHGLEHGGTGALGVVLSVAVEVEDHSDGLRTVHPGVVEVVLGGDAGGGVHRVGRRGVGRGGRAGHRPGEQRAGQEGGGQGGRGQGERGQLHEDLLGG